LGSNNTPSVKFYKNKIITKNAEKNSFAAVSDFNNICSHQIHLLGSKYIRNAIAALDVTWMLTGEPMA